ncbi:nickel ABC transporter, nickel/metallophore periplasmic binding protein [Paenibacillus ferrarius]|uniref:Nickel ABC transporter, nickel/metallophore periplasmic binding protein n=1 Tax=Paenibacillus ferrarius TaxID=1469647 RepID=A0A1V4HIV5_9BACL|nr:nickel ABC transporter substrate-binding protein [Paenibacillus ferrarius]OPH56925.1 nickel ABC transporter, nickel/metallophore periplasmic binding protein [Paenibacillus ferrarius]
MSKRRIVMLQMFIVFVLTIAGCSSNKESTSAPADHEAVNKKDTALIYATPKDINDMNPHLYTGAMSAQGMIFESLVENTKDGIKPALAESWDISADHKEYTFHLRKNVKFHDGESFNAKAVKQNFDAVQANASKHAWIKFSTKIVKSEAIDNDTFKLVLSEPYAPALLELSMTRPYVFLSPKDFVNGSTKDGVNGYNGTGPYKLTAHKTNEYAIFEANPSYWGGEPQIKKITAKVLPSGETTLLALQKGEINFVFTDDRGTDSIDVDAMNQLTASGNYQLVRSESMNTKMLVANSSKTDSPVSETAVREAIWYAIDRQSISKNIFNSTETPANSLFSSNVNYANVELKQRGYDPEMAKKILQQAGWTSESGPSIRMKNGKKLTISMYYDSNSASQKTQVEFIQNSLKNVGFQLVIVGEDSTSIAKRRATGDYDLLFNQTWGLAYDPQSTIAAFTTESSYLYTTKGIAKADELYKKINEVTLSTDENSRTLLYADIMKIVHDEAVFIPLTNGRVTVVAPKNLKSISFKQTQFELPFEQMHFE